MFGLVRRNFFQYFTLCHRKVKENSTKPPPATFHKTPVRSMGMVWEADVWEGGAAIGDRFPIIMLPPSFSAKCILKWALFRNEQKTNIASNKVFFLGDQKKSKIYLTAKRMTTEDKHVSIASKQKVVTVPKMVFEDHGIKVWNLIFPTRDLIAPPQKKS